MMVQNARYAMNMLATAITVASTPVALATQALTQEVTIGATLQEHNNYGGCMVRIDPTPSDAMLDGSFLNCPAGDSFVSFDCLNKSGQVSKNTAVQMFQTAQLALVTGKKIQLVLDDEVKLDGWCLARRVDLIP
ncbi:hypothetical protein OAM23_03680 [Luminiphilus sp.]|nr:hypothetical protein [Luminiphilus sp.]